MTLPIDSPTSPLPEDRLLQIPATRKLRWSRRGAVRGDFVKTCALFAALYIVTRDTRILHLLGIFLVALAAVVVWPFVRDPWVLYRRYSAPAHVRYRVVQSGQVPARIHRAISTHISQLANLGFEMAGYLAHERETVLSVVALMIHREKQDSAHVAWTSSGIKVTKLVAFETRFEDGCSLSTTDRRRTSMFRAHPSHEVFAFPQIRSIDDLYQLHLRLKLRFSTRRSVIGSQGEEIGIFMQLVQEHHFRIMNQGNYKQAPSGERYVFTWTGACRHAWLQAWPTTVVREMRNASKAKKEAKLLGFRIDSKLGRITRDSGN